MTTLRARIGPAAAASALVLLGGAPDTTGATSDEEKPSIALRASRAVSFAPARVVVRAELRGGADDYEEYYCPSIEWDWGDDTRSEAAYDCDPYEPGKSEIRRQYASEHLYRYPGRYQVRFHLKQDGKIVASANTVLQVRPGLPGHE